jgi:flagellar basal-body rod protein FlgC
MNAVSSIALSGLNAATLRLQAAASNIANMRSNGAVSRAGGPVVYTPLQVEQVATTDGGVTARLAPVSREALLAYDPSAPFANADGYVSAPDIDPMGELLELLTARFSYVANLQVLQTSGNMMDDALNILA